MELEPVEFLANYSYFSAETYIQSDEFAECSWGVSCSSLSENSSQNSIQGGSFLGGEDLLELEMLEALGFDSINPDFFATSMDQNVEEMGSRIEPDDGGRSTRTVEENVLLKEEGDSFFKGIQAELMEEDSLTDLLLAAAEAVEAQNQPLASDLTEKLKKLLCDDGSGGMGSSFNRLAWFFTQGLHYRSFNIAAEMEDRETGRRLNNFMSAFQMLQELSPYIKFAHFTANQAILEAAEGERTLHVIDYNIMEGIQWPPLMVDLAARKDVCFLRLTAIVQDHENEKQIEQTGRRLSDFAASINFPFIFDQVTIEKEEHFSKIQVGQTLIANCSNILQNILSHRNLSKLKTFLGGIAKLSPKCIVLVEEELFKLSKPQSLSFVEFFFEAFHHFSALSDSLLKCFSGVYESGFRQLMEEFLGTRILDSVSQFPSDANNVRHLWRDAFDHLKGYNKIPFSSFNHSQAKYLISLFRGDFWVQHEKCRLTLCWKSKPLCAATIWVPRVKNGAKV